jgi:LuxR family maltose regulon positive regulatory protein
LLNTSRVALWLAAGDLETAGHWAQECSGGSELEQITLARLWLAQGRSAKALSLLDRQRVLAEAGGRTARLIQILALQALVLEAQAQSGEASAALSQALSLAWPEGYLRPFLDLGRPLHELLERQSGDAAFAPATAGFVRRLLDAFQQEREVQLSRAEAAILPSPTTESLVDPLTQRELEVLQLLAEGLSNKEIAGKLIVAPSTVKQHLKNIYGKLDVHSRTQAVARGRELELL